jgi:D-alanyl-D-alanine carboxypeptidase
MIKNLNWRPFIAALISVFIITALQKGGVTPSSFLHSNSMADPSTKERAIDKILPKLQNLENTFHLKKESSFVSSAYAGADYDQSSAYAVVDFDTGEVILSKNLDKPLPIASITKVMSSVVALDLASPDELFTVSELAPKAIPTRLALTPGEKMSVEELINS